MGEMRQPELVYWKGSGEVRADLLQAIRGVGYDLTLAVNIDDLLRRPQENLPGLIVVDASGGEAEASKRLIELSSATLLAPLPIIFISYQATKRATILKKTFKKLLPVDVPFKLQNLLSQLVALCPVEGGVAVSELSISDKGEETEAPKTKVAPETVARKEGRKLVIGKNFGGERFARTGDLRSIDDGVILDHHSRGEIQVILDELTRADRELGLHARRVALLSNSLSGLLEFDTNREKTLRVAGLFLNLGLTNDLKGYQKIDLLLSPKPETVSKIAAGFMESAKAVRERLKDSQAADLIEATSELIISGENLSAEHQEAQFILVPELASRSIWSRGYWDMHGAHRVIRSFQSGLPLSFSAGLIGAISKVVCEASEIMTRSIVSKQHDPSKALLEARKEAERMFSAQNQKEVRLLLLEPGMRLSQPVISDDGRLILRANTALTPDLIARLWRLSTITAMNRSVKVVVSG